MAYLDYPGLAYFKSLLDENYLRTNYEGDTVINGNVTFTNPIDASVKNDWLGQQIDKTYLKDVVPDPEGSGALALILGDGSVSHLITDTTVTQVRSNANELYPILLCYDASAEEDQIAKKVWYGNGVRINPRYGYLYSQKMLTLHPTYNRAVAPTSRVEWTNDFRDSVLNPVGQIFEYIDPVSQGGEHRMEFRLYGNPNVTGINTPNINDETNTVSLGVSATRGDALTFFGYAPSTPIYLEDGSTMRKSLVRGDQYGKDIITRDWLNLNGSITGLVHTYMDETIDGYKIFLKTVTIDSGDDDNKAGLNVQGDVNIDSGDASKPSDLYVQGDAHIHGDEDIDGNLNVDGNGTVGGDFTVSGDSTIGGDLGVGGVINKIDDNTTQEYVTYVTNQNEYRTIITDNLLKTGKGLAYDSDGRLYVDFSQIDDNTKAAILAGLNIQIPLTTNLELIVNKSAANKSDDQNLQYSTRIATPFEHIQAAVTWATSKLALNTHFVTIKVVTGTYVESVRLPEVNASTGYIRICTYTGTTDVTIESPIDTDGHYLNCIYANSGSCHYALEQLTFKYWLGSTATTGLTSCVVGALVTGARISLYGCVFNVLTHPSLSNTITGAAYQVRMIDADAGGQIDIFPYGSNAGSITANLPATNTAGVTIAVLNASRDGRIYFRASKTGDHTISCNGSCTYFLYCWSSGGTNCRGSGNGINFTGTMTGYKYYITKGSYGVSYDANLPGTSGQEYVQESTYCWYSD